MLNKVFKNILFLNVVLLSMNSCGFKGPLYIEAKDKEKPKIKTTGKCIQQQTNIIESEPKHK